ncbi:MAG: DUF2804 family protein, partial [Microvirgula sp.]
MRSIIAAKPVISLAAKTTFATAATANLGTLGSFPFPIRLRMNGFTSFFPPAPACATDDAGRPRCGRYTGLIADTGWSTLALSPFARLSRRLRHKRWQYAGISHPRFFVGLAVVDAGWIASGFCYVFDRSSRRMVAACASDGLPGLHAHVADTPLGDAHY